MEPQAVLTLADQKRRDQQWREAVLLYQQLQGRLAGQAAYHHNLALCLLGAGEPSQAVTQAERALEIQPTLWQSAVVKVRALTVLGQGLEAAEFLKQLCVKFPERGEFALELATVTLHEECNARKARELVKPWLQHLAHRVDAQLTDLMASLYDRDEAIDSAQAVNDRAIAFAAANLDRLGNTDGLSTSVATHVAGRARKRIGLLSPLFSCSPVYFFCIGSLELLSADFDLYFFNRGKRTDWATQRFRDISTQWFDVADQSPEKLDLFLRQHDLDVLIDLGGWMDPLGLKAISTKPAKKMYKWVGGQSITTGLRAFDGFISDEEQTPQGYERWFTEPLIRLPHGYISYSPPSYLPEPIPAPAHAHVLGIIANPVKVSQPFLRGLQDILAERVKSGNPLALHFIDKRYKHPQLLERLRTAVGAAESVLGVQLNVQFIVPNSHQAYLKAVGELSEMVDTFPYTGGLTTMEALSLGVPTRSQTGVLFCERHTHAHVAYLKAPGQRRKHPPLVKPGKPRQSLVPPNCPRADHAALAQSLSELFNTGSIQGSGR